MFETARNNGFGIAKQRQDPSNYSAPPYVRNEFGASIGGPIVLPHLYHGKDKSFFFFAYERYSLAQTSYDETTMPTMAMRNGDWSGLVNGSGVLQQLYDPATTAPSSNCNGTGAANQWCRTPFPNNQIPIGRLSPTAKVIYAITPPPTTAANPLVTGQSQHSQPHLCGSAEHYLPPGSRIQREQPRLSAVHQRSHDEHLVALGGANRQQLQPR